jgi:histidinol-phosphate aminotransferase
MASAATDRLSRYPSTYSHQLRAAIADYIGVNDDEVMVGCGSDELLGCAFRALGSPGEVVAYMDPTFVMARVFAQTNSLTPVAVPLSRDLDADADALTGVNAPITYICSPNNPTGASISPNSIARVLRNASGLVFLDEAYAEYAGTNVAATAPTRGRLLVFRTFSKAFGLAGARVGFVVGERPLIAELEKVRGPYTVTALSEIGALAAITEDLSWVAQCVADVRVTRDAFSASLIQAGFKPLPSDANFVLVPVRNATAWSDALRQRSILVRHFPNLAVIGDALRITIGQRDAMDFLARVMRDLRGPLEETSNA